MRTIVFTGGGTGGHVYPGLAVWERLPRNLRDRVRWIGSRRGVEREILRTTGIPYAAIPVGKLRRYFDLENVLDVFRVGAGILAARRLLRRLDAAVVFSKGGFVAVPVVLAARLLRIPVVIHESDFDPGLATRITAPLARVICVPYPETVRSFPSRLHRRVLVTGNPVRSVFLETEPEDVLSRLGLRDDARPVLLVTGGSLGAQQLNRIVAEYLEELTRHCTVVHQTGHHGSILIQELAARAEPGRYTGAAGYDREFAPLLRRADLVICRAGAGTIWELAVTGTPAVLIPLDAGSSRGDQVRNARYYAAAGAAVVPAAGASSQDVVRLVRTLLADESRRREMSDAARRFARGDGAVTIAGMIRRIIE